MKLRQLENKDAEKMLEWMHDEDVTEYMLADFNNMQLQNCVDFIENASKDTQNKHFAVCDENDEYLGTISLKNINERDMSAEYAVIFRKKAIGSGAAFWATREILKIGFETMNLNRIYLDVLCDNKRAVKFYNKVGFIQEGIWRQHFYLHGQYRDVLWLSFLKDDWEDKK